MHVQPPLTIDDKLNVVAQLCDGLSYAHEQGVVHRDVKPDNVFILEDGSVKLLDFGIAKLQTSTLTRQGDVLGSASYMSPEQVGGSESVDGRADIFSTGVVLYELLTGKKPFEGDSPTAVIVKILKDDPNPIDPVTTGLPADVIAAAMKALQKDPANRFQTADAMSRELQNIRKGLHPSISKPSNMDETRFASTQVLRALHDDFEKARTGAKPGDTDAELTRAVIADQPAARGWVVPAGVGAVVLVAAIGAYAMLGRTTPPPPATVAANSPPTETALSKPPVEATPTATATPPPAAPAPAPSAPATPPAESAASTGSARGSRSATREASNRGSASSTVDKPAAPPPSGPTIEVTLTGGYPFEVVDGQKVISASATSHELKQQVGKALTLRAPQYFLNQTVRVEGSANQPFEFAVPGLGSLAVRSTQETCDVAIQNKKLGNPPLTVKEIAAGSYKVDLVCGSDVVKSAYATVQAGHESVVPIR